MCCLCFPEPLTQNPTAIVLICIGVGAIVLVLVALGLCLRRRSVSSGLAPPTTASLLSLLCRRAASAFTPSSPLPPPSPWVPLPLTGGGEEFALNTPCHC